MMDHDITSSDHHFVSGKGKIRDSYSFNYVYTCDIEDVMFRIKIDNLDGIVPPTNKNSNNNNNNNKNGKHHSTYSNNNYSPDSFKYSSTSIQNHYNYNVVEVLEELSLIDQLVSSDDEEDVTSGTSGAEDNHNSLSGKKSFGGSDSKPTTTTTKSMDSLAERKKQENSRHKKNQKLAEIIFGGLNQPFRALSPYPFITCDLVSNGQRLCPPQETQCKQMTNRYEWNEWLTFSLGFETLPRDTRLCFTIWDTSGPGKMIAIARTSISLFGKHGCMRKGLYDLRLYFNDDFDENFNWNGNGNGNNNFFATSSPAKGSGNSGQFNSSSSSEITKADVDFVNRNHRNKELIVDEREIVLNGGTTGGLHQNKTSKLKSNIKSSLSSTSGSSSSTTSSSSSSTTTPATTINNNIAIFPKDTNNNNNGQFDLSSVQFTSTTQYLQNNLQYYPDGNCGLSLKVKQLNKLKKKYYNGQMPKLDWLDRLTFLKIERIVVDEKSLSTLAFLTVEFPVLMLNGIEHCAVYYEDRDEQYCQYDIIENEVVTILDPELHLDNLVELKHHKLSRSVRSGISDRDLKPNAAIRNQLTTIVNCPPTKQLTNEEQDLVWKFRFYLKYQKKALTKFLKTVNWNSNFEVGQAIDLMNEWTPMDVEDALELLSPHFRHPAVRRYAVYRLKEALDEDLLLYLLQLVQALKYENFDDIKDSFDMEIKEYKQQHQQQRHSLDSKTERQSSHDTSSSTFYDSLSTTTNTSGTSTIINQQQSNTNTLDFDYKFPNSNMGNNGKYGEDLATFLINRACSNDSLANYFFWYLVVECEADNPNSSFVSSTSLDRIVIPSNLSSGGSGSSSSVYLSSGGITSGHQDSDKLLSNRHHSIGDRHSSSSSPPTANQQQQAGSVCNNANDMYLIMMKRFSERLLNGTPEMVARRKFLIRQQEFVAKLVDIMKVVARENGNRLKKIDKLQSILRSPEPQHRFNFGPSDPLPLPLNPDVRIVDVIPDEAILFKSAMMPAKLAFRTTTGSIYYVIFKHGDDLRQDDLVLQMIILMDKLLRMENLDLKLTPYRVLACSSKHGFVQFIQSQSVADVISSEGSIQNYLRKICAQQSVSHNVSVSSSTISASTSASDFQLISNVQSNKPSKSSAMLGHQHNSSSSSTSSANQLMAPSPSSALSAASSSSSLATSPSISPEIMDAYIKSCAGYCVITYLLGVGDRHLDNLLLTHTGRLFHIDFGFILGRDPKVRPPSMKITREMVDTMGGTTSENFTKFCSLVRTAFLHLRRHANLILNLFSLLVDANVPDIALEPDKTVQKVQDKFKLELPDEQAIHHITEQVEQSLRSIMPVVVDQMHKITQYLRN